MNDADSLFLNGLGLARTELAKLQADLRLANDWLQLARLNAEWELGESVNWDTKTLGSNESDRKRRFDAAVLSSDVCIQAQQRVRELEREVALLAAQIDSMRDAMRLREIIAAENT